MDCRRCNFYLCSACQTTYTPPDNSIWGAFSSMVDFVKQDFAEMAADLRALTGADEDETPQQQMASETVVREVEHQPYISAHEREEAQEILAEFCERYPESRIVPDEDALDGLWTKVSLLYGCSLHPGSITAAVCQQLRWPKGEQHWQPRLRALHALAFFHEKGAVGREISNAVSKRAEELLRRLAIVPECQEKATELLRLYGKDVVASGNATGSVGDSAVGTSASAAAASLKESDAKPEVPPAAIMQSIDLLDIPPDEPPSVIPSISPPTLRTSGATKSGDLLDLL